MAGAGSGRATSAGRCGLYMTIPSARPCPTISSSCWASSS